MNIGKQLVFLSVTVVILKHLAHVRCLKSLPGRSIKIIAAYGKKKTKMFDFTMFVFYNKLIYNSTLNPPIDVRFTWFKYMLSTVFSGV